jgi:hypothetical protein
VAARERVTPWAGLTVGRDGMAGEHDARARDVWRRLARLLQAARRIRRATEILADQRSRVDEPRRLLVHELERRLDEHADAKRATRPRRTRRRSAP